MGDRKRICGSIGLFLCVIMVVVGCWVGAYSGPVEIKKRVMGVSGRKIEKPERGKCEISEDGLIRNLEVNQVMSYGQNIHTGELYLMDHFVAGKETAIYVPLNEKIDVGLKGKIPRLTIKKEGELLMELDPVEKGKTKLLTFMPKYLEEVGYWEEGRYTFEVSVGESFARRQVVFNKARKLKILAVPITGNYGGDVREVSGEWQTAFEFTNRAYPLAHDGIEYVLGQPLDLSDIKYDLYTEKGMYNAWRELKALQTPEEDYELIIGFVRNRVGVRKTFQGYTFGLPAHLIAESDGDMQCTVAHEIAHSYGVGDEYSGGIFNMSINPVPYGMEGRAWDDTDRKIVGKKRFIISGKEMGSEASGTVISKAQRPVDHVEGGLSDQVSSFMGSGSMNEKDYWITSAIWEQLYRAFVRYKDVEDDPLAEEVVPWGEEDGVDVSAHAPEVSVMGIAHHQTLAGKVHLSWEGQDLDGDTLVYNVWYGGKGGKIQLMRNTTEKGCVVDFDALPAYEDARIYVEAWDGVRTGIGKSPSFKVAWKAPEIRTDATTARSYALTDMIEYDVSVYDLQDGFMNGKGISWFDASGNVVGTSSKLRFYPYELEAGEHTFTLQAINSGGKVSRQTYTMIVQDDESQLPNDWSREDLKEALKHHYVLPLESIEKPITRRGFAELAYRWDASIEGIEKKRYLFDYTTLKDCEREMLACFYMVGRGVMRAPDGFFEPEGTLTEEEGIRILMKLLYEAQPIWMENYLAVDYDTYIQNLEEVGILGGNEANAYTPDQILTKQLALVRIARLEAYYHYTKP